MLNGTGNIEVLPAKFSVLKSSKIGEKLENYNLKLYTLSMHFEVEIIIVIIIEQIQRNLIFLRII